MDDETVKRLIQEIQKFNIATGEGENIDTVDGFKDFVRKQLHSLCSQPSVDPSSCSSVGDFQENRTAYVASEARHKGDLGEDVYDFTHPERGLAVVINNEDFSLSKDFGDRPGSSYDAAALYQTFKKLGFKVLVKENLTSLQILDLLKLVKDEYNHSIADCFVCAILSHGDETREMKANERNGTEVRQDLLFGVDGKAIPTRTIVEFFNDRSCRGLQGKPRLFFFQACRGSKYDQGTDVSVSSSSYNPSVSGFRNQEGTDRGGSCADESGKPVTKRQTSLSSSVDPPEYDRFHSDSEDAKPGGSGAEDDRAHSNLVRYRLVRGAASDEDRNRVQWSPLRNVPVSPTPLYKDCLIMYATPPGYYAWRRKTGAWFVQSVCKVLSSPDIGQVSLLNALVKASGLVAFDYQSENPSRPEMHQKKESPVIESMLVKDVFFINK